MIYIGGSSLHAFPMCPAILEWSAYGSELSQADRFKAVIDQRPLSPFHLTRLALRYPEED